MIALYCCILDQINSLLKVFAEHFASVGYVGTAKINAWVLNFKVCTDLFSILMI